MSINKSKDLLQAATSKLNKENLHEFIQILALMGLKEHVMKTKSFHVDIDYLKHARGHINFL